MTRILTSAAAGSLANPPRWVVDAVTSVGLEPAGVRDIRNPDPFSATARTFLVTTTDGQLLKARRMLLARHASRAQRLAAELSDPRIPTLVGRRGRVTLERWVPGQVLSSLPPKREYIAAAADLLALIHRHPGTLGRPLPQLRAVAPALAEVDWSLEQARAAGVLAAATARTVRTIVHKRLPARATWGLTHNDLTAANLVLDSRGRVVSIDNERLGWGFLDADVARTWARWPLRDAAVSQFENCYRDRSGRGPDVDARTGWRVAAALASVGRRVVTGGSLERPLARLEAAVTDAGDR